MNPPESNPLTALKDIQLPLPPGWWPPAPGWWLLLMLVVAVIGFGACIYRRRQLAIRPVKLALAELYQLDLHSRDPLVRRQVLSALAVILRRFCLVVFPRQQVAGLYGQAWLDFLKAKAAEQGLTVTDAELYPLVEEAYAPASDTDLEALGAVVAKWVVVQKCAARRRP